MIAARSLGGFLLVFGWLLMGISAAFFVCR
nr:MAG TPA: hypothetical protein [Caudoviricetes sp.]